MFFWCPRHRNILCMIAYHQGMLLGFFERCGGERVPVVGLWVCIKFQLNSNVNRPNSSGLSLNLNTTRLNLGSIQIHNPTVYIYMYNYITHKLCACGGGQADLCFLVLSLKLRGVRAEEYSYCFFSLESRVLIRKLQVSISEM